MTVAWTRIRTLETVRNSHLSGCILKVEATDFACRFPMDTKNEESRLTTSFCLRSHSDGNSSRAGRVESLVVSAPNSGVGEMVRWWSKCAQEAPK